LKNIFFLSGSLLKRITEKSDGLFLTTDISFL